MKIKKPTHIYKLVCIESNEIIYIGSTKRDIKIRFIEHCNDVKHEEKRKFLEMNPCVIRTIEDVFDEEYVKSTEQFYIDLYESTLKFNRINAYYDKWNEEKKATKRAKEIINNLNK
jgi:hypothetical protein